MGPAVAPPHYLRVLFGVSAGVLAAVALINLAIDPYDVSQLVRVDRLNSSKPKEWENARLKKPFDMWRRRYDGVALGTSQVERGIDPAYSMLRDKNISLYNSGLSGLRLHEARSLLANAIEESGVRFGVIALDFERYVPSPLRESSLPRSWSKFWQVSEYLKSLVSGTTLLDGISTVRASWVGDTFIQHLPNGLLNVDHYFSVHGFPDFSDIFDQTDANYINGTYSTMLSRQSELMRVGFDHSDLRAILQLAQRHRVRVLFFVSPIHAREMEVIRYLGLMPLYRQWLGELTCIIGNGSESASAGPKHVIWDFSGYNSVTTEPVPAKNDKSAPMKWYYDSIHYSNRAGRAILNRLLDLRDPAFSSLQDFGVPLDNATLPGHLDALSRQRERYVLKHPEVPEVIAGLRHGPPPDPPRPGAVFTGGACSKVDADVRHAPCPPTPSPRC